MKKAWENSAVYKSFSQASRLQQEVFISRFSQIMVIGLTIFAIRFFFIDLNSFVGVVFLPVALIAAWFLATKVVAPRMVLLFDKHLNREQ